MSNNTRTIHTGLYSDRAYSIFQYFITYLNNAFCDAKKTTKTASLLNTIVKRAIDNEIVLESTVESYAYRSLKKKLWNGLTDNQVLRHIVWLYKLQLQQISGNDAWKRSNLESVLYTTFKLNEVYFLYDMFHQRKNFKRNYPESYSDMLIGMPLDPITVELKNTQAEEIAKINAELQNKCDMLRNQKYTERDAAYKAIDVKYEQLVADAKAEAEAKIQQLKDEMKNIESLNLLANVG